VLVRLLSASAVRLYIQCDMMSLLNLVGTRERSPGRLALGSWQTLTYMAQVLLKKTISMPRWYIFMSVDLFGSIAADVIIVDPTAPSHIRVDDAKLSRTCEMYMRGKQSLQVQQCYL
jgi:hypothetical protein